MGRNIFRSKTSTPPILARTQGHAKMANEHYPFDGVPSLVQSVEARVMRRMALGEDRRADGRRCDEVRPISSRAGLLPSTHGSSLFTRGETQTIAVVTLGAPPLAY